MRLFLLLAILLTIFALSAEVIDKKNNPSYQEFGQDKAWRGVRLVDAADNSGQYNLVPKLIYLESKEDDTPSWADTKKWMYHVVVAESTCVRADTKEVTKEKCPVREDGKRYLYEILYNILDGGSEEFKASKMRDLPPTDELYSLEWNEKKAN